MLADEILVEDVTTDNDTSVCENINVLKSGPVKNSDPQNSDINLIEIDLRNKIKEVC